MMNQEKSDIILENKAFFKNKTSKDLIDVLHHLQSKYGYLSKDILIAVSKELDISLSKVFGVVSFYNFFKLKQEGKIKISVCDGTVCHVKGSQELINKIKEELNIKNGKSIDNKYSLNIVRCLGLCASAPVMIVNGKVFTHVNPSKIKEIFKEIQ